MKNPIPRKWRRSCPNYAAHFRCIRRVAREGILYGTVPQLRYYEKRALRESKQIDRSDPFDVEFAGLRFLACNSHELDIRSQLFDGAIKPHHQGLLGFTFTGKDWRVSLYQVPGGDEDMGRIAKNHGGGGHRGAAGFRCVELPPFKLL